MAAHASTALISTAMALKIDGSPCCSPPIRNPTVGLGALTKNERAWAGVHCCSFPVIVFVQTGTIVMIRFKHTRLVNDISFCCVRELSIGVPLNGKTLGRDGEMCGWEH